LVAGLIGRLGDNQFGYLNQDEAIYIEKKVMKQFQIPEGVQAHVHLFYSKAQFQGLSSRKEKRDIPLCSSRE